jgi:hypothetical protein
MFEYSLFSLSKLILFLFN